MNYLSIFLFLDGSKHGAFDILFPLFRVESSKILAIVFAKHIRMQSFPRAKSVGYLTLGSTVFTG